MKKILFFLFFTSIVTQVQTQNLEQIDKFFDLLYQNDKLMGSVSVMQDGKQIYSKQVGSQYIGENEKLPITNQSKFRIGSITKTFTAVMIFQLVDEGKIRLHEKLANYFPEIPNANFITIANLLNHSSGLFNITADENFDEHQAITKEEMLTKIKSYKPDFQPSEKNEYSNTNYVLLGYILEAIEKDSYKNIVEKRVVNKLNLKDTYFGDVIDVTNNECLSYYYEEDASLHEAAQAHLSNPGGAGAMVSNPDDLVIFMHALFNDKLMTKKSFEIMTTVQGEYGSGILSAKKGGQTIYAHNGGIDFFKSMVVYIPKSKVAIAFNANALDYGMMPIMFNIMTALSGKEFDMPNLGAIEIALSASQLNEYTGTYTCEGLPYSLVFETDGKVLKGAPEGSNLKLLKPTQKDEFVLEGLGVVLNFDLKAKTLLFKQAGETPKKCSKKE